MKPALRRRLPHLRLGGALLTIEPEGGEPTREMLLGATHRHEQIANDVVRARALGTGSLLWTWSMPSLRKGSKPRAVMINNAALMDDGFVISGRQEFNVTGKRWNVEQDQFVVAMDEQPRTRWQAVAPLDKSVISGRGLEGEGFHLLTSGQQVFAVHPFGGVMWSVLFAFSQPGKVDWRIDNDYTIPNLCGAPGIVFDSTRARAFGEDGRLLWEGRLKDQYQEPYSHHAVVRPDGAFVFVQRNKEERGFSTLYAFSRDGSRLWQRPLDVQAATSTLALADDGTVFVALGPRVMAIDRDGELIWERDLPVPNPVGETDVISIGPTGHLYLSTPRRLYALWIGKRPAPGWSRWRGGNDDGSRVRVGH